MSMRAVLMPVHAFPPLNNGGTFRVVKFAKFLPEFGWEPVVVAPQWNEENSLGSFDRSMVGLETCEVIRVPFVPPPVGAESSTHNRMRRWWGAEPEFGRLPSDMLTVCRTLLRDREMSAVFASSFPRFLHRIANVLHREFGIPWIADHRDLVDQEGLGIARFSRSWLRLRREVFFEARFTRNAAAVTSVSTPLARRLQSRNRAPVFEIMNGFDPDDYSAVNVRKKPIERFRIVYCGSFFGRGDPTAFLDGLDLLCEQSPETARLIQVWFYGQGSSAINDYLNGRPCADLVHARGFVPHMESLQIQADAHVVYLISHPSKGIATGKIFEYLNAGVPILSVPGDRDVTDRIIAETGAGVVCRNKQEVCAQLLEWIGNWKEDGTLLLSVDRSAMESYTRRRQTGQLASILDDLVRRPR